MLEITCPIVSIILPTYNRARFLPGALAAIHSQQFTDWELIVIDDGSTDNTRELVLTLTSEWRQRVRYVYQENQGAYGARNLGLDLAEGTYIAFYDSDDVWLPHHLQACVRGLQEHPDVAWIYGACRIVDLTTQSELSPSVFYSNGKPQQFLSLQHRKAGEVSIIEDADAASCQITDGLFCFLQNSVIHKRVFANYRFESQLRNEAEDLIAGVWALSMGFTFAYIDQVHSVYHVHESNSSSTVRSISVEKQQRLHDAFVAGFERLQAIAPLSAAERRAIARRLGDEYFWILGYATHWMNGNRRKALLNFCRGITYSPWNWRYWKTLLASLVRCSFPFAN